MFHTGSILLHHCCLPTHNNQPVWKTIKKLDRTYKPKDITSKIIMKSEVEAVVFKQAGEYYTEVISIMSGYSSRLSDTDILMIIAGKTGILHTFRRLTRSSRRPALVLRTAALRLPISNV